MSATRSRESVKKPFRPREILQKSLEILGLSENE
jgi:hypothetical protein